MHTQLLLGVGSNDLLCCQTVTKTACPPAMSWASNACPITGRLQQRIYRSLHCTPIYCFVEAAE